MEKQASLRAASSEQLSRGQKLGLTVLACACTTLLTTPLQPYLDLANIVMLFLLTVLLVAVNLGRGAAILAAVLSILLFDLFFVPPRFSLAVNNIQYLVTFAVMLVTGLITAHLAAGLKQRAQDSQIQAQRTQALYQFSRQLAGTLTMAQVADIAQVFIKSQFNASSSVLLPDDDRQSLAAVSAREAPLIDAGLALVALENGQSVRSDLIAGMGYASLYLPLRASTLSRGVLAVRFEEAAGELSPETVSLLETSASLIGVAVERLGYVQAAQATEVKMLTERLRSSILSALSHDLRTPLTAMVGLADSLSLIKPALPAQALETAQALHEQAARLTGLVSNLLDMARLNAGEVTLRREWQPLEEVVGASIKLLGDALDGHPVKATLPKDLPLLEFDAVLIERVLGNLLENAAKYSPDGGVIELSASEGAKFVEICVADRGPGFPATRRDELFKMFVRGETESGKPGTGLGLAICKTIVEAHGGTIDADTRPGGGACVRFTLPKGIPPVVEEELP